MTTMEETKVTTQVYRVYIKATPEAIWEAITTPEWSARYGYGAASEYELSPGGAYRVVSSEAMKAHGAPEVLIDGEVVESDPPHRLVQTWRALFDEETAAEGFTRLLWELEPDEAGITRLTVTHELEGAPRTAHLVAGKGGAEAGGGWSWILSDLKTLLETGASLQG